MRDFRDAKSMASSLRGALAARGVDLTRSEGLELIAKAFGFDNWNILAARIQGAPSPSPSPAPVPHAPISPVFVPAPPVEWATAAPGELAGPTPLLPLRDIVVFPDMVAPLFAARPPSLAALGRVIGSGGPILLVAQRDPQVNDPGAADLHRVGVLARVAQSMRLPDGSMKVMVHGQARVRLLAVHDVGEFKQADVEPLIEEPGDLHRASALAQAISDGFSAYAEARTRAPLEALQSIAAVVEPGRLADAVAPHLAVDVDVKQDLLETADVPERLEKVLELIRTG